MNALRAKRWFLCTPPAPTYYLLEPLAGQECEVSVSPAGDYHHGAGDQARVTLARNVEDEERQARRSCVSLSPEVLLMERAESQRWTNTARCKPRQRWSERGLYTSPSTGCARRGLDGISWLATRLFAEKGL